MSEAIESAMKVWKAYNDKPCRPPFLVPSDEEIQAAYVLADAFLEADNTKNEDRFATRLADVEARAEAVKNDFATRIADAEDKADRYRLALERCRMLIDDDAEWAYGRPVDKMRLIITGALRELSSARLDREGRDVSDLPGLWDEGDTFEKASVTSDG